MTMPAEPVVDPAVAPAKPAGETKYFTEADVQSMIEKARQQEKDKLYPTISKADERAAAMEAEVKELSAFRKKAEKDEQSRLKAVEDAQRAKEEAEMSAKDLIAKRDAAFDARIAQIQAENELRVAMLEKANEAARLEAYIQRRAAEENSNIVPELVDFINGNTAEEVEASIQVLKAKSQAIAESARGARSAQLRAQPGVAPSSGTNGVTIMDQPGDRQLSADDIRGMSMQEFAALRKKVNMPSGSGRGLFD